MDWLRAYWIALAATAALGGCAAPTENSTHEPATNTTEQRQADWENQQGDNWDQFSTGYVEGFDDGCQELFDQSPNGSLYENGQQYGVDNCMQYEPADGSDAEDIPTDVPDNAHDLGYEQGEEAGCRALFDQEGVGSLNYGPTSYTADECPVGSAPGTTPSKPPPPPRPTRPTTSRANAESNARNAANTYTSKRYSIGGRASDWSATCQPAGEDWGCQVTFNQTECTGSVVIGGQTLRTLRVRVGCSE